MISSSACPESFFPPSPCLIFCWVNNYWPHVLQSGCGGSASGSKMVSVLFDSQGRGFHRQTGLTALHSSSLVEGWVQQKCAQAAAWCCWTCWNGSSWEWCWFAGRNAEKKLDFFFFCIAETRSELQVGNAPPWQCWSSWRLRSL